MFLFFITSFAIAQIEVNFQDSWMYGSEGNDGNNSKIAISDSGDMYIATGSIISQSGDMDASSYGSYDIWLIKLDESKNILWQKSYGGDGKEQIQQLVPLSNGNALLFMNSHSKPSGNRAAPKIGGDGDYDTDIWIVEVSGENGDILKEKSIGGDNNRDDLIDIKFRNDNEIYVLMYSNDRGTEEGTVSEPPFDLLYQMRDPIIFRLDADLNVVSQRRLTQGGNNGGGTDSNGSLWRGGTLLLDDEYFYVVSSTSGGAGGDKSEDYFDSPSEQFPRSDAWVVKMDYEYNVIWDKVYGGNDKEVVVDALLTESKELILFMKSYSRNNGNKESPKIELLSSEPDMWLIKLDENGDKIADKAYGSNTSIAYWRILPFGEDNYILCGTIGSNPTHSYSNVNTYGGSDGILTQINGDLEIKSNSVFGESQNEWFHDMTVSGNQLYVLGATNHSGDPSLYIPRATYGNSDLWLLEFSTTLGLKEEGLLQKVLVYPNPTMGVVNIEVAEAQIKDVVVSSLTGQELFRTKQNFVDLSVYPSGVYFVKVQTDLGVTTQKVIKE